MRYVGITQIVGKNYLFTLNTEHTRNFTIVFFSHKNLYQKLFQLLNKTLFACFVFSISHCDAMDFTNSNMLTMYNASSLQPESSTGGGITTDVDTSVSTTLEHLHFIYFSKTFCCDSKYFHLIPFKRPIVGIFNVNRNLY